MLRRRDFIRGGIASAGALTLGPAFWESALAAAPTRPGAGPYGPLGSPDANGLRLPAGFQSREIARGGVPVGTTGYIWHGASDGSAAFALGDGGFILVSNSEIPGGLGGASSLRFDSAGNITGAYRILGGTDTNCAGGPTPWGTWLSCEEVDDGQVWECDPFGVQPAVVRPALGTFKHEAVCVDPLGQRLYLTEDIGDAGFYRFTPAAYPSLDSGLLEIAVVGSRGRVTWKPVPRPLEPPIRAQVPDYTRFRRGEGIWFDSGIVYMATTADDRVWAYNTGTGRIEVLYDGVKMGTKAPLHGVDNITVAARSGDLFVAEDGDDLQVCIITPQREVSAFLQVTGAAHSQSEITGPAFDPTGTRFFFSSQRGFGPGVIYEVTGPFR